MQMRCKLPNEFAIRRGGCLARAVPANFMNGPAWGVGQRAGPPPHFPALRLRHAEPHVAASRPAASRSAASDGAREASGRVSRQPATRCEDTPPGALQGLYPLAPLSGFFRISS